MAPSNRRVGLGRGSVRLSRGRRGRAFALLVGAAVLLAACKRNDPPPDLIKTQREAMDRAKEVGKTMQKGVDAEGRKADEESR
jgi:hypothetical protein